MPLLVTGFWRSGVDPVSGVLEDNGFYFGEHSERLHMAHNDMRRFGMMLTEHHTRDGMDDLKLVAPYRNLRWSQQRKLRVFNELFGRIVADFEAQLGSRKKAVDWAWRSRRSLLHLPFYSRWFATNRHNTGDFKVVIVYRHPDYPASHIAANKQPVWAFEQDYIKAVNMWTDYYDIARHSIAFANIAFFPINFDRFRSSVIEAKKTVRALLRWRGVDDTKALDMTHLETKSINSVSKRWNDSFAIMPDTFLWLEEKSRDRIENYA